MAQLPLELIFIYYTLSVRTNGSGTALAIYVKRACGSSTAKFYNNMGSNYFVTIHFDDVVLELTLAPQLGQYVWYLSVIWIYTRDHE